MGPDLDCVDSAPVHTAPAEHAPVEPSPVQPASVDPDPVRPARSCLASVHRKRAGSARRKRVAFDEKVKVQYHDRCPSFDRFPSDRLNMPLGMYPAKSHCGTEPLSEEKDTRYKLPRLSYQQRFELLGPVWDTEDAQTQREWSEDSENLETIMTESMQSGCDCFGGFCDKYCECIQAGIKCCVSFCSIKDSVCVCAPYGCSNQDESGINSKQRVKNHRNATFARLEKEREEEMDWHQRGIEQATRKDDVQEQLTGSDAQSGDQSDSKVLAQVGDPSGSKVLAPMGSPSDREVSASVVDQSVSDTSASVGDLVDSNQLALVGDPSGGDESAFLGNLFGTELLASVGDPSDGDVWASMGDPSDGDLWASMGDPSDGDLWASMGDPSDGDLWASMGDPSDGDLWASMGDPSDGDVWTSMGNPSDGDVSASVGDSSDGEVLVPVGESSEMLDQDDNALGSGLVDMYGDPCDSELPAPHGRKRLWSQTD